MSGLQYTRYTFRGGELVHKQTVDMDQTELVIRTGRGTFDALLALVNGWNAVSARGVAANAKLNLYVYVAHTSSA